MGKSPVKVSFIVYIMTGGDFMPDAGYLRKIWNRIVPGAIVGVPVGLVVGGVFREIDWEKASYVATVVAGSSIVVELNNMRIERKKERLAEEEQLEIKREEIDAALVQQYIAVLDDFIEHPELDYHHKAFEESQKAQQQRRIYEKLILLFATAFRRLHGSTDSRLQDQWYSWEDDIHEWISMPNFRAAFDDLMMGEADAFIEYMQRKKAEIPETANLEVLRPRKRKAAVKKGPEALVSSPPPP